MAKFNSKLYASQSYSVISDRPDVLDNVQFADAHYVFAGTEAAGDTLNLVKLPANSKLIPQLSSLYADDPGTVMTVNWGVGDSGATTGSIATSMDIKAGGAFTFADGTAGTELVSPTLQTAEYDVTLTVVTASGVTEGADLIARIAYQAKD